MAMKNILPFQHRLKQGIFPVDYFVLIYSLLMAAISIVFNQTLAKPWWFLTCNLAIISLLLYLIYYENRDFGTVHYWLHTWLPIITFMFYYTQSTFSDNLIFNETFDPVLQHWDNLLFGFQPNQTLAPAVNSMLVNETMHLFYFSYYLLLFIPGTIMLLNRRPKTHEMIFTLTIMMYVHYIIFILFPGDGPVLERPDIFSGGLLFIPIMNFIYSIDGFQGGGAFPSTHVTSTVIIFLYSFNEFKSKRRLIQLWSAGIVIATVYCSYHYAVDAIAGLITGTMFYFIGRYLYSIWDHPAELPAEL